MRLVRYGCANGWYSSNSLDALSATPGPAWRFARRGNIFRFPFWPTSRSDSSASWPSDIRPWNKSPVDPDAGNPEEKVPRSEGISSASGSSSVRKIKPISLKNTQLKKEENPAGRKLRTAKKEEDISVNLSKKPPMKKIHF
jgi:hypothetical protein